MNQKFDADQATALRAERVIEQLLETFDQVVSQGLLQPKNDVSQRVLIVAYGWWAYINRMAQAALTLRRAGLEHEASPIIRTILQYGLSLQWLTETGDTAVDAVEEYADDNMRLLQKTLGAAKWAPIEGFNLETPPRPPNPNPLVNKLRNFEELCISYGARELYVPFRALSAYVHPTTIGARAYLDQERGTISAQAVKTTTETLIIQTAMCLIQAGKAFSGLIDCDQLTTDLSAVDKTLGLTVTLWVPKRPS